MRRDTIFRMASVSKPVAMAAAMVLLDECRLRPDDPDEWMRRLGELPPSYQLGQRWQYDLSHEVLCVLVARVTSRSFGTFLRERILDPLGMRTPVTTCPPTRSTGCHGHHAFFRMPLNEGTYRGRRILSRPAVELMTTNRLTGILLTQVGMSTPDPARLFHDFWTTLY